MPPCGPRKNFLWITGLKYSRRCFHRGVSLRESPAEFRLAFSGRDRCRRLPVGCCDGRVLDLPEHCFIDAIHGQFPHATVMAERAGALHAWATRDLLLKIDCLCVVRITPGCVGRAVKRDYRDTKCRCKMPRSTVAADHQPAASHARFGESDTQRLIGEAFDIRVCGPQGNIGYSRPFPRSAEQENT